MRHFQRGMAAVPAWAPADEDHLLGSTSVARSIRYGEDGLAYATFDPAATEVLRLRHAPAGVSAGRARLPRVKALEPGKAGYTVAAMPQGGFVVRIRHRHSGEIGVRWRTATPGPRR